MSSAALKIEFGGISVAGRKDQNQDAFAVCEPTLSMVKYKGVAACIADGVSCSENAQQASSTSVTHFLQDYYSTPDSWDVKTAAGKVLSALNSWLYHHGQQASARHNSLVTTFSGLVIKGRTAHLFHAGDSRIYHWHDGHLEQVSRDHVHQTGGREALSRAMGMDTRLEVDYIQREVQAGDIFLLTTDGVHGVLPLAHLQKTISTLADAGQRELERQCQTLIDEALAAGSDDNLTCVILRVADVPVQELEEAQRSASQRVIPPVFAVGERVDDYRILEVVHANNRSYLYRVQNQTDGRIYALKAPSINFEDDPVYLEGFAREQWIGSRLDHPNLMKVYPQPEGSRFLYLVSEWLEGISLRQWMHDHPQPELPVVRSLVDQIIHGLRALQRLGMVHRDIKPENVILTSAGFARIIDYGTVSVRGLAELGSRTAETIPVGSVNYIAPEYVVDGIATTQSDMFSLAVMVYEMLCGHLPFDMEHIYRRGARSVTEWKYRPLRQHRPDLPLWLDLTLQKAMHPSVNQRYQAFSEFRTDLFQPNQQLLALHTRQPLIQRDPLLFWKALGLIASAVAMVECWWILTH